MYKYTWKINTLGETKYIKSGNVKVITLESSIGSNNQLHTFQNWAVSNQQTDRLTYRNGTLPQGPDSGFMKTPYYLTCKFHSCWYFPRIHQYVG